MRRIRVPPSNPIRDAGRQIRIRIRGSFSNPIRSESDNLKWNPNPRRDVTIRPNPIGFVFSNPTQTLNTLNSSRNIRFRLQFREPDSYESIVRVSYLQCMSNAACFVTSELTSIFVGSEVIAQSNPIRIRRLELESESDPNPRRDMVIRPNPESDRIRIFGSDAKH